MLIRPRARAQADRAHNNLNARLGRPNLAGIYHLACTAALAAAEGPGMDQMNSSAASSAVTK